MISGLIFETLRSLVNDRCYPSTFPQPIDVAEWPAIRFTITRDPEADLCGTDDGVTDTSRVQLDLVAKSYGAMVTLRSSVITALDGAAIPYIREFEQETYDTETKTHRVILEVSFHPSTTTQ